jgi:hypothetical protein
MAWGAKKTEHAGAKKGTGAFYGRKVDAKRASSRRRRQSDQTTINIELRNDKTESQRKALLSLMHSVAAHAEI